MFVLDTTTRTLEVLLDAAPATSQLPVVVTYADVDFAGASPHTLASSNTITNSTTAVTAAAAPASGVKRQVEQFYVRNDDTATRVVKLRYNDNGTLRNILWPTLLTGEALQYTHADGLCTLATDGSKKVTWTAPSISQGGGFVRVNTDGSVEVSPASSKNLTLDSGDLALPSAGRLAWSTDVFLQRKAAGVLALYDGANAQELDVYRTRTDASNGEWFGARWNGTTLEVGAYANGTGTVRPLSLIGSGVYTFAGAGAGAGASLVLNDTSGTRQIGRVQFWRNGVPKWQFGTDINSNDGSNFNIFDQSSGTIFRLSMTTGGNTTFDGAHVVMGTDNTYNFGASGGARPASMYLATSLELEAVAWVRNHPGRKRLTANATNATATMSSLSDLTVTLAAGRKYTGTVRLIAKNSTGAEGLAFDFNGGGATMTSFHVNLVGTPVGATVGVSDSTALGTALTCTAVATTDVAYEVNLTLVCNAGGTFILRFAEVSHTSGTATVELGSYIWLEDSPN